MSADQWRVRFAVLPPPQAALSALAAVAVHAGNARLDGHLSRDTHIEVLTAVAYVADQLGFAWADVEAAGETVAGLFPVLAEPDP